MIINLCGGSGGGSSAPIKLQGLIARENGTYTPDEGYDGYSEVLVDVTEPVEVFVVPDGMKFQGSTFTTLPDSLDFSEITDMSYLFENCYNLNDGNINTNSAINMEGLFAYCYNMITAPELKTSNVTSMRKMFYGEIGNKMKLETVPFYDTTNVTDMSMMFYYCNKLETIPPFNTSNVTNMRGMFSDCSKLKTIPPFNTSKVTNMANMFCQCASLQSIPELNTSNVTDMASMFYICYNITEIPQLDTSNVNNVGYMFNSCRNLKTIPQLNFGSVTNTRSIFRTSSLPLLTDLGGFTNLKISWTSDFLDRVPYATVESLMNVINNLWDWTDYPDGNAPLNDGTIHNFGTSHSLKFGSTNLNKLSEEQIAVATAKGWTLTA